MKFSSIFSRHQLPFQSPEFIEYNFYILFSNDYANLSCNFLNVKCKKNKYFTFFFLLFFLKKDFLIFNLMYQFQILKCPCIYFNSIFYDTEFHIPLQV